MTTRRRLLPLLALGLTIATISACSSGSSATSPGTTSVSGVETSTAAADAYTPLVPTGTSTPRWFTGTDGLVHLVYEVQLTNGFALPMTLDEVTVDGDDGKEIASFTGTSLTAVMSPLGAPAGESTTVAPSSVAVLWMDLTFDDPDQLPASLSHTFTVTVPDDVPIPNPSVYEGARTDVDRTPPVVLGPPLAGPGWIPVGSCCAGPHRRALPPRHGKLELGQRFAIDWNGMDDGGFMLRGDASVNANWVFYDAPVLAVADGTVVVARDYLEDQIPNAPTPVGIEDGDGNHVVIDIGDGRYVFYAHLAPGSVTVKEGDRVCSGQQIGRLGNTGSSTGPHLHVHVSDSVSALDADGLPYVISGFQFRGQIPPLETEAFALVEAGKPLPVVPGTPQPRTDQLPMGRDVVDFPDTVGCSCRAPSRRTDDRAAQARRATGGGGRRSSSRKMHSPGQSRAASTTWTSCCAGTATIEPDWPGSLPTASPSWT